MVSRVSHTTIGARNAFELSSWWKSVLHYADIPGDPNEPGDEECMILDPVSGHRLLFVTVGETEPRQSNLHLDLAPTDRTRDEEIARVLEIGATASADRRKPDGSGWMVLTDPEGNEFCIVRSDAERAE